MGVVEHIEALFQLHFVGKLADGAFEYCLLRRTELPGQRREPLEHGVINPGGEGPVHVFFPSSFHT